MDFQLNVAYFIFHHVAYFDDTFHNYNCQWSNLEGTGEPHYNPQT